MSIASVIGLLVTTGVTKPSAPNWKASAKSFLVPTSEPIISIPSNTVLTIGTSIVSEGNPTATTFPAALTESMA